VSAKGLRRPAGLVPQSCPECGQTRLFNADLRPNTFLRYCASHKLICTSYILVIGRPKDVVRTYSNEYPQATII